jgi:phage terminase large subunit-like protein
MKTHSPKSQPTDKHTQAALQYANDVIAGVIPACKWVKLACQRHLNDLARPDFPYTYDTAKAERACKFIEALPHVKGTWASRHERLKLGPWQSFVVCSLFGWIAIDTGQYRFREVYACIPRKNGKSVLAAAIGLFKFAADNEFGAEVYSGATSEKQAWEVMLPAKLMAQRTPALLKAFGIQVNGKSLRSGSLTRPIDGSRFEPIIGKPGDGASPSCAIADEYHEHETDVMYSTMKTGMGARENPLMLVITTAGSNQGGPCYMLQTDAQKMLEGVIQNDRLFAIIYSIDATDKWDDPASLQKANPNYGVSVFADFLLEEQKQAVQSSHKQNHFRMKHLNEWVNAKAAWLNMASWNACADPALKEEQFKSLPCHIGMDLGAKVDLTACVKLFQKMINGKRHYYVFGTYWLPEDRVQEAGHTHYQSWLIDGWLRSCPGAVSDFDLTEDYIRQEAKVYQVVEINYDQHHAHQLVNHLMLEGLLMVSIPQIATTLSEPMKELEAAILDGRFHHNGDPVLAWAASNVVAKPDKNENLFPDKERPENKIDPISALLNALMRAMRMDVPDETQQEFKVIWY